MSHIRLYILGNCAIEVDGHAITPTASHLFALLLLLSLERHRWLGRSEIQDLVFADSGKPHLASHSLRQLLYRLRRMQVLLEEGPSGLRLCANQVLGPLEMLRDLHMEERARFEPSGIRVLASYAPRLSLAYLQWVDDVRDRTTSQIRHLLLADLAYFRSQHSWEPLARVCATLRTLDPLNEEVALANAEALAMTGMRHEAIDLLDSFAQELLADGTQSAALRQLRARIAKCSVGKNNSPLVGRDECLRQLHSEWECADEGGARLAVLIGAAGLGKTRVVDDFSSNLQLTSAVVIHYRCDAHTRDCPLSLFSHILPTLRAMRGSLGIAPRHQTLLDRLRPTHGTVLSAMLGGVTLEAFRSELQSALVDILEAVSAEHRLMIAIDDAHLLDSASCDLILHLADSINDASLLIVASGRPGEQLSRLLRSGERSTSHLLCPLTEIDSLALFQSLVAGRHIELAFLKRCLSQSAGNPFYLHAIARNLSQSAISSDLPLDVASLASGLYFALTGEERLVLESCLFLGGFATFSRIRSVTTYDDIGLAGALRVLEEQDLISLDGDVVRGAHSLLDDAIRLLIPKTVSALLRTRIAHVLDSECASRDYSAGLAVAAARSWLAAGDVSAALVLMQRCAAEAASIGELAAAADLLAQILPEVLSVDTKRILLDDIVKYASAGGSRMLAADSLRSRLLLGHATQESPQVVKRLELQIIEADILSGGDLPSAVPALMDMLAHSGSDHDLKMQCMVHLLVIADAEYDTALAGALFASMSSDSCDALPDSPSALRAQLVYHTTFGAVDRALAIIRDLRLRFPAPLLDDECRTARRFASYSLYRLMLAADARVILEADYDFMSANGIRSEALYAASLLTEIAIAEGDFEGAEYWFGESGRQLRGASAHRLAPNSGYYSSAALFLMRQGRYHDAAASIAMPQKEDSRMRTARYEAICIALTLRLRLLTGEVSSHPDLVARLRELYERGRALGGQDTIVELLWCADVVGGREQEASNLLGDYLGIYRRERLQAEWSLRHTTAADAAWLQVLATSSN